MKANFCLWTPFVVSTLLQPAALGYNKDVPIAKPVLTKLEPQNGYYHCIKNRPLKLRANYFKFPHGFFQQGSVSHPQIKNSQHILLMQKNPLPSFKYDGGGIGYELMQKLISSQNLDVTKISNFYITGGIKGGHTEQGGEGQYKSSIYVFWRIKNMSQTGETVALSLGNKNIFVDKDRVKWKVDTGQANFNVFCDKKMNMFVIRGVREINLLSQKQSMGSKKIAANMYLVSDFWIVPKLQEQEKSVSF